MGAGYDFEGAEIGFSEVIRRYRRERRRRPGQTPPTYDVFEYRITESSGFVVERDGDSCYIYGFPAATPFMGYGRYAIDCTVSLSGLERPDAPDRERLRIELLKAEAMLKDGRYRWQRKELRRFLDFFSEYLGKG